MDAEFNVADAFKKPDRSAALAGRLATRPQRTATRPAAHQEADSPPTTPAVEEESTQATTEAQTTVTAPQKARRRPSPRKTGQASDGRLVISIPIALRDRARAHAASRRETYLDVALAAVQDTHERLPQLVAARHSDDTASSASSGSLFEHRPRPRRTPEATAQVTIRGLSTHDRAVLEQLVDDVGAANITELLTVALDEHLPQRPRALR